MKVTVHGDVSKKSLKPDFHSGEIKISKAIDAASREGFIVKKLIIFFLKKVVNLKSCDVTSNTGDAMKILKKFHIVCPRLQNIATVA